MVSLSKKLERLTLTHPVFIPLFSRVIFVVLEDILAEVNVVIEGLSSAILITYAFRNLQVV